MSKAIFTGRLLTYEWISLQSMLNRSTFDSIASIKSIPISEDRDPSSFLPNRCPKEANTRFHQHQNTSSTNGIVSACRPPITPPQPHDVTPQTAIWCNHQSWSFILIINYKARMENGLGRNAVASFVRVHSEAFWKNRNVEILNKLSERIFRFKFYYLDF